MSEDWEIRYTRPMDAIYLKQWLMRPEVWPYLQATSEKEFDELVNYWMFFAKYYAAITATIAQVPCAIGVLCLMPYRKISHHCNFQLCVNPDFWHRGIGFSLLKNLKHLAKEYFHLESIHTEVFGSNPIISLLEKQNFHPFFTQENYVKTSDGYLCRKGFITDLREGGDGKAL